MFTALKKYQDIILVALLGTLILATVLIARLLFGNLGYFFDHSTIYESESTDQESSITPFLVEEEVVVIEPKTKTEEAKILPVEKVLFEYVEVRDSCSVHYVGECVLVRTGPGIDFPIVMRLRNHVILKVSGKVEHDGHIWYKIVFDEVLHYPERILSDWYVAADHVDVLLDEGDTTVWEDGKATTTKNIIVDVSEQKLYAYDGETLFMETSISTGLELSPTPRGTFTIFKKTPSRYMQGPLPGYTDFYDLPGVPWNLYFTQEGAVIHGAYWHDSFGSRYSHGCVNLSPEDAHTLYIWALLGTKVTVR